MAKKVMKKTMKSQMKAIPTIFSEKRWITITFSKTDPRFNGLTREEYEVAREKHVNRHIERFVPKPGALLKEYKETVFYFSTVPYEYLGDGLDDFHKYQCPCALGYIAKCPGERANDVLVTEPYAVKHLLKKYNVYARRFCPENIKTAFLYYEIRINGVVTERTTDLNRAARFGRVHVTEKIMRL